MGREVYSRMLLLLGTLTLLISSSLACAPHKPMQSARPPVYDEPQPQPQPQPMPETPEPAPKPEPETLETTPKPEPQPETPEPTPKPEPTTTTEPSSTRMPQPGCPILSPDIANCESVFAILGERNPSAYCSIPTVATSSLFECPDEQPVILVCHENTDPIDMYASVECDVSSGAWIFYGETERRSDEMEAPITVTCVNPNHTGNQQNFTSDAPSNKESPPFQEDEALLMNSSSDFPSDFLNTSRNGSFISEQDSLNDSFLSPIAGFSPTYNRPQTPATASQRLNNLQPQGTDSCTSFFTPGFYQNLSGHNPNNSQPLPPSNGSTTSPFTAPSAFHNLQTPHWTASSPFGKLDYSSHNNCQWTPQSRPLANTPDLGYYSSSASQSPPSVVGTPIRPFTFPSKDLPANKRLKKLASDGKPVMWYFLLKLLIDPTKKSVIVWTGNGKEFRILNSQVLSYLWSQSGVGRSSVWESVKKNIRNCYEEKILGKTARKKNYYAYLTEPSMHVDMTSKLLDIYIALNHENGPLTTGSPITFPLPALEFPKGTRLQVNGIVPLREKGTEIAQSEYIEVTLVEENLPTTNTFPPSYNLPPATNPSSLYKPSHSTLPSLDSRAAQRNAFTPF